LGPSTAQAANLLGAPIGNAASDAAAALRRIFRRESLVVRASPIVAASKTRLLVGIGVSLFQVLRGVTVEPAPRGDRQSRFEALAIGFLVALEVESFGAVLERLGVA